MTDRPNPKTMEENVKTYTARLEREKDGRWTVEQALARMREAAALWFEADEHEIELVPHAVLPEAAVRTIEQARQAREEARRADRLAVEQTKKAAAALADRGISLRDAAAILGISHQRVHQLLTPEPNPTRRRAG